MRSKLNHLSAPSSTLKQASEEKVIAADRAFFKTNPSRNVYARWAGDIEEMGWRKMWGISPKEPGRALVVVRQMMPGMRYRHPRFTPFSDTDNIHLPTSDDDCAALIDCAMVVIDFADGEPTICAGSLS